MTPAEGAPLRVAVVGVGHLGQHHARLWATMEGCRLVAVVDADAERARAIAGKYGDVASHTEAQRLVGGVDAVSIAVPTLAHKEVAIPFLEAGIPVLVEKPMAPTLEDADAMISTASRTGTLLGVGHTERFNPAIAELARRVKRPRFIECHRLGSFAPRSLDIDVVLDLMIHDLDIALSLVGGEVKSVAAVGVAALTRRVDIANARLVFEGGCVANLTASRVSAAKTRKIRVFQRDSYLSCDCAAGALEHYRLEADAGSAQRPTIVHETVSVGPEEPLLRELSAFAAAVRGRAPFPVAGGEGRRALAAALAVARAIEESFETEE
jgi:predicted dehydrogenase